MRSLELGRKSSDALKSVRRTRDVSRRSTSFPTVAPADAVKLRNCGVETLNAPTSDSIRSDGTKLVYTAGSNAYVDKRGVMPTLHPPRIVTCIISDA